MAYGLFATLIMGTIIQQAGSLISGEIGTYLCRLGETAIALTGAGIGVGVASKLNESPLVVLSAAIAGIIGGYAGSITAAKGSGLLSGPGEPLGAFIAAYAAVELGRLIAGRTKMDIILVPIAGILAGSAAGILAGPPISRLMSRIGDMVIWGTNQQPFLMGIVVSVLMGMLFTLPVSAVPMALALNLSGPAAGAATVGCCCSMIGFAVASFKENGVSGLLAQGIGTSMLQIPNIVRRPLIWLPPILSSAILGPVSTMVFKMTNNAIGSGMGTAGLVGQIMTWQTMVPSEGTVLVLIKIVLLHFLLPGLLSLCICNCMRKLNWIKPGDMKLEM